MPTKLILLIEPEFSLREVLHVCLRELGGWQVALSGSIQEGMRICQSIQPDAILLDTSTAETDVLLFVEQLKQHSIKRSIPILLITARASWFTPLQLRNMGFAGAIEKPFNPSTLSAQIAGLLETHHFETHHLETPHLETPHLETRYQERSETNLPFGQID